MEQRARAKVTITQQLKAEFLAAIADEYGGASDFFQKKIKEGCGLAEGTPPHGNTKETGKKYTVLDVSVTPEQRAALLAQCEREGVTMGTWMRNEIKAYLAAKKRK